MLLLFKIDRIPIPSWWKHIYSPYLHAVRLP